MNNIHKCGMQFAQHTNVNLTDKTYEAGAALAESDIERFGTLHAMDKLGYLEDGPFASGYADKIIQR